MSVDHKTRMGVMKTYLNGEQCEKEKKATGVLRKLRERMEEEYQEEESMGENVIRTLEKRINNSGSQGHAFQYGSPLSRQNTGIVPATLCNSCSDESCQITVLLCVNQHAS